MGKNKSQNTNIVTVCSTTLVQHALHVIKALQFIEMIKYHKLILYLGICLKSCFNTKATAQWVRVLVPQEECLVFESQPRQN